MKMHNLIDSRSKHETDVVYLSEVLEKQDPNFLEFATAAGIVVKEDLTNVARMYKPEQAVFIADAIAPVVAVSTEAGRYTAFGQEGFDIDTSDALADDGEAGTIDLAAEKVDFAIDPRGLQAFVSDRLTRVRPTLVATTVKRLKLLLTLRQEIRVRNLADAATGAMISANLTNFDSSATVNADIMAAVAAFEANLGISPNRIVLPKNAADAMVGNSNIANQVAASMAVNDGRKWLGVITSKGLEASNPWGLQPLFPSSFYTTTAPGLARTKARVWANDGFLVYTDSETETSSWAVQFSYLEPTVVSWRDESRGTGGAWYKVYYQRKEVQLTPEAIYKLLSII
jgi:hypothetical protein